MFSIAMGADYSFYMKSIGAYAPAFLRYNNSVLARVNRTDATTNKIEFILRFFLFPYLRMSVLRISVNSEAV